MDCKLYGLLSRLVVGDPSLFAIFLSTLPSFKVTAKGRAVIGEGNTYGNLVESNGDRRANKQQISDGTTARPQYNYLHPITPHDA